jgi:tricarballylate dehydrogenase
VALLEQTWNCVTKGVCGSFMEAASYDVIIVGAGNAAMAAAVSAREKGASRVLVLEKAPAHLRGGNTRFTGGLFRFAFECADNLGQLMPEAEHTAPAFFSSVPPYPPSQFYRDLMWASHGAIDHDMAITLVTESFETLLWMRRQGIALEPARSIGAVRYHGKLHWSPGAVLRTRNAGMGLSDLWFQIAANREVEIRYSAAALSLARDECGRVAGLWVKDPDGRKLLPAKAVVLGCGGFEANADWRRSYLGPEWENAKIRGTAFNTGDGLRMAFALDAIAYGQFSGCHCTPIDTNAPALGDLSQTDQSNRLSYPHGVMLNRAGQRFFDEGENFQFYTYARLGALILQQPGGIAFQIFDAQGASLLEPRYRTAAPIVDDSLPGLIHRLGIDRRTAIATLEAYNNAPRSGTFDPSMLDGFSLRGISPPKSNWARQLTAPPFYAYATTGGLSFTFGGVKINKDGQVLTLHDKPIPGLFACGEIVGGLFYNNYLGGSGLTAGAVFGRAAGASAASYARLRNAATPLRLSCVGPIASSQ